MSQQSPIVIEEDDRIGAHQDGRVRQHPFHLEGTAAANANNNGGNSDDDSDDELVILRTVNIRDGGRVQAAANVAAQKRISAQLPAEHSFRSYNWQGTVLRAGLTVELHADNPKKRDFLYITAIVQDGRQGEISLKGLNVRRLKFLGGLFDNKLNEVCLLLSKTQDDDRDVLTQSITKIPIVRMVRTRKLRFSTKEFTANPNDTFRDNLTTRFITKKQAYQEELLACRWLYTTIYKNATARQMQKKSTHGLIRRFMEQEISEDGHSLIIPAQIPAQPQRRLPGNSQTLTYGSGCCGAGGDVLGAQLAGAKVVFGWDRNKEACKTIRSNFPLTTIAQTEAMSFPPQGFDPRVDILHLSWPCDYYSPNHTVPGRHDGENMSAIFMTSEKLKESQPIYHTQENTSGLFSHHPIFFVSMIREIITTGYNVSWKVVQFAHHGSPASRNRLIIFAAKTGWPLPPFPEPTHGPEGSGLLPLRSINDALSDIPWTATWHAEYLQDPNPTYAYDGRTTQAKCVTRNGGNNRHPSGRPFTPRELASLQGFPTRYKFVTEGVTEVRKMIGNAVPPNVWQHFIGKIIESHHNFTAGRINKLGQQVDELGLPVINANPSPLAPLPVRAQRTEVCLRPLPRTVSRADTDNRYRRDCQDSWSLNPRRVVTVSRQPAEIEEWGCDVQFVSETLRKKLTTTPAKDKGEIDDEDEVRIVARSREELMSKREAEEDNDVQFVSESRRKRFLQDTGAEKDGEKQVKIDLTMDEN